MVINFDMESESDDIASPSSPGNRFLHSTLPDRTETTLLEYFSRATSHDPRSFTRFASDKTTVFGTGRGTKVQRKLRVKVRNRVSYLWNHPHILQGCLERAGLPVPSYISNLVCGYESSEDSSIVKSPPRPVDLDIVAITSPPKKPRANWIVQSPPPPREGELTSLKSLFDSFLVCFVVDLRWYNNM